jgi:hypothetical protein
VGRLDTLRENVQNGKESVKNCSLNDLWWRIGGQGFFYLERSHSEPLINLEIGPQCEAVTFLIDSGASRSSLCLLPRGLIYSLEKVLTSGVKGDSFSVKIL